MRNAAEVFADTIARLPQLSMAELTRFKLAVGTLALGDPDPDEADDDPNSEYADEQTEAYLALLDLIDQELERRRAIS
jgi:hypothetical protein